MKVDKIGVSTVEKKKKQERDSFDGGGITADENGVKYGEHDYHTEDKKNNSTASGSVNREDKLNSQTQINSDYGDLGYEDFKNELDIIADRLTGANGFSYDAGKDEKYLSYLRAYRDSGEQAMKAALASAQKMSGGYGNSYAARSAQNAYEQYMSKAADAAADMYDDAYSRYRDTVSDYRDARDFAYKKAQQDFENRMQERRYASEVGQQLYENRMNEQKYKDDLDQREYENKMNTRKYYDGLYQQYYDNQFEERKYSDTLAQRELENRRYEREYNDSQAQEIFENNLAYAKLIEDMRQNKFDNSYRSSLLDQKNRELDQQDRTLDQKDRSLDQQDTSLAQGAKKISDSEAQWRAEFNEKIRQFNEDLIYKKYFK